LSGAFSLVDADRGSSTPSIGWLIRAGAVSAAPVAAQLGTGVPRLVSLRDDFGQLWR
jgi:hypothetical protein